MSRNTPPPPPSPIEEEQQEDERTHEVILEEQEEPEVEVFVCGAENKEVVDEQNAWEEETEYSVVETASQIESKGMKIELKQEKATIVNDMCRNWIRTKLASRMSLNEKLTMKVVYGPVQFKNTVNYFDVTIYMRHFERA